MSTYDVFLSYNHAETAAVEAIALRLRDEARLRLFFDEWDLLPGEPFIAVQEAAVEASRTIAVFFGPAGVGAWQEQEKQLALELITRVRHRGGRIIPVLLPGGREEDISGFLRLRTWVDLRKADGFRRLVAGIEGRTARSPLEADRARGELVESGIEEPSPPSEGGREPSADAPPTGLRRLGPWMGLGAAALTLGMLWWRWPSSPGGEALHLAAEPSVAPAVVSSPGSTAAGSGRGSGSRSEPEADEPVPGPRSRVQEDLAAAERLRDAGEFSGAEQIALRILEEQPAHEGAWLLLADVAIQRKDLLLALGRTRELVGHQPDSVAGLEFLCRVQYRLSMYEEAQATVKRWVEVAPESSVAISFREQLTKTPITVKARGCNGTIEAFEDGLLIGAPPLRIIPPRKDPRSVELQCNFRRSKGSVRRTVIIEPGHEGDVSVVFGLGHGYAHAKPGSSSATDAGSRDALEGRVERCRRRNSRRNAAVTIRGVVSTEGRLLGVRVASGDSSSSSEFVQCVEKAAKRTLFVPREKPRSFEMVVR